MKTIVHDIHAKDKLLHIETELGVINIRTKLYNEKGELAEVVELLPDEGIRVEPCPSGLRFVKPLP